MDCTLLSTEDETLKRDKRQTITSLEVAEMVGKEHSKLLRDIRVYSEQLNEAKIGLVDFFTKSTYIDSKGETRPCYDVTKKGCEFIAHKLTGVKGTEFTAKYINRFHEMEDALKPKLPTTYRDAVAQLLESLDREEELKAQLDTSKDWYSIKRVAALNGVSWKKFDWRKLKRIGEEMGYEVKKIFDANYGEVNTYHKTVWEKAYPQYEL